jgi:hypothetical protein
VSYFVQGKSTFHTGAEAFWGRSDFFGFSVRNGGHDCAFKVSQGLKVNGPFTQVEALFGNSLGHGGDSGGGGNMFDLSFENKGNRLYWLCTRGTGEFHQKLRFWEFFAGQK